jgi:pyridoxal phosphate enzyme (YggS family)
MPFTTDRWWHFIGHLQSNKAKYAVRMFDLIHSVDSFKLAGALDKEARKNDKVQDILVQVNISREETKSGIEETEAVDLVTRVNGLKNIRIKGLMTMPPFFDQPEKARPYFRQLARCVNGSSRLASQVQAWRNCPWA